MGTTVQEELKDEFLTTLRKGQDIALDALKTLVETIQFITPSMPAVRMPLAGRLPGPREIVADGYDFAEALLANQRKFADEVIDAVSPLAPAKAAKPVARAVKAAG